MLAATLLWASLALLVVGTVVGLGAVTLRLDVMGRAGLAADENAAIVQRVTLDAQWAMALVVMGVLVRAWAQAAGLAFPGESLVPLFLDVFRFGELRQLLLLQAVAGTLAIAAFTAARAGGLLAWLSAAVAVAILAVLPGLGGHAAAAAMPAVSIAAATLHVVGVGAWLGTLWHLWRSLDSPSAGVLVARFHWVALSGAAIVALSGATQSWDFVSAPSDLVTSTWGRLMLTKLALVAVVLLLGHRHWRGAEAALATGDRAQVARSFRTELVVAAAVVMLSALLATTSPPA